MVDTIVKLPDRFSEDLEDDHWQESAKVWLAEEGADKSWWLSHGGVIASQSGMK